MSYLILEKNHFLNGSCYAEPNFFLTDEKYRLLKYETIEKAQEVMHKLTRSAHVLRKDECRRPSYEIFNIDEIKYCIPVSHIICEDILSNCEEFGGENVVSVEWDEIETEIFDQLQKESATRIEELASLPFLNYCIYFSRYKNYMAVWALNKFAFQLERESSFKNASLLTDASFFRIITD